MTSRVRIAALALAPLLACSDSGGHRHIDSGVDLDSSTPTDSGAPLLDAPPGYTHESIQNITVEGPTNALVVVDVNSDTHPDVIAGTTVGPRLLRGAVNGSFSASTTPVGSSASSVGAVAVARLNADVHPDLVVGLAGSAEAHVYFNSGNVMTPFGAYTSFATQGPVGGLALVDVNGDTFVDIVAVNPSVNSISVLLGNGAGSFDVAKNYAAGLGARFIASADFDEDGHPDLVTANERSDSLSILLGTGAATPFESPVFLPMGREPRSVAIADFDADGNLDLAAIAYGSSVLSTFLGKGDGTFRAPLATTLANGHTWIAAGDITSDGRQDLFVVGVQLFNPVSLAGRGDGSFVPLPIRPYGMPFVYTRDQSSVAIVDVDHDDQLDLVVALNSLMYTPYIEVMSLKLAPE